MEKEINIFFNSLDDPNESFLLRRLYSNPSSVLGNNEESVNFSDYFILMFNNNLLIFLEMALKDNRFKNKLNPLLYNKLGFFLTNGNGFKEIISTYDDELKEDYESLISLMSSKINNFNFKKATDIRKIIQYELENNQENIKDKVLFQIENDDYTDEIRNKVYLYNHPPEYFTYDKNSLEALVCENRFTSILEKLLKKGKIRGISLNNAIDILILSIGVKKYTDPLSYSYRDILGDKKVKDYDLKRANEVLNKALIYKEKELSKEKYFYIKIHK